MKSKLDLLKGYLSDEHSETVDMSDEGVASRVQNFEQTFASMDDLEVSNLDLNKRSLILQMKKKTSKVSAYYIESDRQTNLEQIKKDMQELFDFPEDDVVISKTLVEEVIEVILERYPNFLLMT